MCIDFGKARAKVSSIKSPLSFWHRPVVIIKLAEFTDISSVRRAGSNQNEVDSRRKWPTEVVDSAQSDHIDQSVRLAHFTAVLSTTTGRKRTAANSAASRRRIAAVAGLATCKPTLSSYRPKIQRIVSPCWTERTTTSRIIVNALRTASPFSPPAVENFVISATRSRRHRISA